IKVFSGVPSGISTRPVLAILPTSENTLVPALLALPVSVNQAGPLATMGAMLHQVSTLLMLVGLPHRPFCAGNGGRGRGRGGEGSRGAGSAGASLHTNKGPRALHQLDIEVESAAQDVVSQQTIFSRLFDTHAQTANCERILRPDVDNALSRTHRVSANDHPLQQRMGIAFDFIAVHIGAGIALVGVADEIFRVRFRLSQELPFIAGEKAGAATSTQPGRFDLFDHAFRASIDQYLVECLVTTDGDILLDVFGIDQSAIAQDNLLLSLEKG